MSSSRDVTGMLTGLLEASHLAELERLPFLVGEYAARAGLREVAIYLADLQQTVLRPLAGPEEAGGEPEELRIDATLAGRAFQEVRPLAKAGADGRADHWWVPVLDGTGRLGVLRVRPAEDDQADQDAMRHLASMVALLLVSYREHSDSYARLVRTRPMNVAAEMQWNLMPPLTFANRRVTVSAVMEPAYEVGGDTFDYAIAGETLHLAVFDAMGHDTSAGLTANLAMAACRNHRRQGMGLADNSEAIERVLIGEFGRTTRFVTAIMADLDMTTGLFGWVNRGHHPPVVIRHGRWVTTLRCVPAHPMGLNLNLPVTSCREQLEPGDRVLLYTDGITEARGRTAQEFGLQRFVDFVVRHDAAGLPVPETLRRLTHAVLDYHGGRLQDDATVLLVEWHGTEGRRYDGPEGLRSALTGERA
ncbi:PP2C family protein-serine/threonine phosphatase [Streptosporangium sp. NPDC020072]|uniref:PP2C family protein-serine/threonine phosphatase n=1 Tax=Streptosporangium sp. NPDC020072 TaxID=3154788 RepID=UPI0034453044